MDGNQSQSWGPRRGKHNSPLSNGDTAGVSDPYASSPYGGSFEIEPTFEIDPNAAQVYSCLPAPIGTRSFKQHDDHSFDSSFRYQNHLLWDGFATEWYMTDWILAENNQECQFPEVYAPPLPAVFTNAPAELYGFNSSVDQQTTLDVTKILAPNTPYIHNESDKPWHYSQLANYVAEENPQCRANDPGDEIDSGKIDISTYFMELTGQQLQWDADQPSHHTCNETQPSLKNYSGNVVPHESIDWLPLEMIGSNLNWSSVLNPPTSRSKLKMRAARRPNPARRARTKQHVHPFEGILHLDLIVRNSDTPDLETTSQKRFPSQDACVSYRISKRRCDAADLEGGCGRCLSRQRCLRIENMLPMSKLPKLYTETKSYLSSLSDAVSDPPRIHQARVYVSFGSGKLGVPLACKISEAKSTSSNPPWTLMAWENLRSSKADKNCIQIERLACCFIPQVYMPSAEALLIWAVESVQKLPSGVVEDFYGPLYTFATNYITVGSRPLHKLMALTVIHTALYNVCHTGMMIVFDKRPRARVSLPLRLREQICRPLFQLLEVTRAEVRKAIIRALHGPSVKERLAFCVSNWLLLLTYEHCLDQTPIDAPSIVSDSVDAKADFAQSKKCFEAIVRDLRDLQKTLFKKFRDLAHPIFDASWKANDDDHGNDDHDLRDALSTLRTAMIENQVTKIMADASLIRNLAPQLYPGAAFQKGHAPMSVTDTVSTSKKLDFDNMSANTGLETGDGNEPLSRPQAVQKVLQNLRSQHH